MRALLYGSLLAAMLGSPAQPDVRLLAPDEYRSSAWASFPVNPGNENLRAYVRDSIVAQYPSAHVFGHYLDCAEKVAYAADSAAQVSVAVPENLCASEMQVRAEVDKSERMLRIYQIYNGGEYLVVESPVALGGWKIDYRTGEEKYFGTPSGSYHVKRFVHHPWWYPPEWAEWKDPSPPWRFNPLGDWMAELFTDSRPAGYSAGPEDGLTRLRLHMTALPESSLAKHSTHGCVATSYEHGSEMFPALLEVLPHLEPRETDRGIVYPLLHPFEVRIKE